VKYSLSGISRKKRKALSQDSTGLSFILMVKFFRVKNPVHGKKMMQYFFATWPVNQIWKQLYCDRIACKYATYRSRRGA
jgi:hypothetical protein